MLMVDQLFKRAMKGQLDIVGPAWAVQKELTAMPSFEKLEGPYVEMEMTVFQKMWDNRSIRQIHIFGGDNYKRLFFDVFR